MTTVAVEFDGVEGLYVLEALAGKSAEAHARILRMIEQGVPDEQFEMSVAMTAAVYIDAAHRKVESAIFGDDDDDAIAHMAHDFDPECERCIEGTQEQFQWAQ